MVYKKYLFSPGPVMTSDRVKSALIQPDICHRRQIFEQIYRRVRNNLLKLYRADDRYVAVVISGSGTAANETALSSIIKDDEEVLLVKNGEFGERLEEILTCYHKPLCVLNYNWGQLPEVNDIKEVLQEKTSIQWVCIVYHETSTGMINPVRQVGEIVSKLQRKLYVDCVSAVGGEDINVVRDHIDVCSGVPNKAVAGIPGVSFIVSRREIIPSEAEVPVKNIYLNLQKHIRMADKCDQTPNTPSVAVIVALDEALQELLDEGLENRIQRYRNCARVIRQGIKNLNLQTIIPDELCSNTVTSVFLPENLKLDDLINELDERGYVVYPGKRHLYDQNMFQIANMGQIQVTDCHDFLVELEETLEHLGRKDVS
jgi:2-aminoethylphosphonate-pyruvate transaminase